MRIETNSKSFQANWTLETATRSGARQLVIELDGETPPDEIVGVLTGQEEIREIDEAGNAKTYKGYTMLSSLIYAGDRSAARLTLERA